MKNKVFVALLLVMLIAPILDAAIAFDNAASTSSAANVSSLETGSWAIAGSERILIAGAMSGAGTPVAPSAAKWGGSGGTDLTIIGVSTNFATFGHMSQWRLVAPSASTTTLYVSWPSNQDETAIGGASYTGVDQTTPLGTQASATGAPISTAATVDVSSAAGELVVDVVAFLDNSGNITSLTAGAGQTARVDIDLVGGLDFESFGMSEEAGAATVTMSWTGTGTNTGWTIKGVPLKPSGGAPTCVPMLTLLGVGAC